MKTIISILDGHKDGSFTHPTQTGERLKVFIHLTRTTANIIKLTNLTDGDTQH